MSEFSSDRGLRQLIHPSNLVLNLSLPHFCFLHRKWYFWGKLMDIGFASYAQNGTEPHLSITISRAPVSGLTRTTGASCNGARL